MTRPIYLASTLAVLALLGAPAEAGPTKAELLGDYTLDGSDTRGNYQGTLAITDGGPHKVQLEARLRYADGSERTRSCTAWYVFGRIYSRDAVASPGLIGGLSGGSSVQVRGTHIPNERATRLEGSFEGPGFTGRETATRQRRGGCTLTGKYTVSGNWDSFSKWYLEFKNGVLIDSHTDDLTADEWPTTMTRDADTIHLIQVTRASDAILTEGLILTIAHCLPGQSPLLVPSLAYSNFIDLTSQDTHSSRVQGDNLSVERDLGGIARNIFERRALRVVNRSYGEIVDASYEEAIAHAPTAARRVELLRQKADELSTPLTLSDIEIPDSPLEFLLDTYEDPYKDPFGDLVPADVLEVWNVVVSSGGETYAKYFVFDLRTAEVLNESDIEQP